MSKSLDSEPSQPKAEEVSKWRFVLKLRDPEERQKFYDFMVDEIEMRREAVKRGGGFLVKKQLHDWVVDMQEKEDKIRDRFPKVAEALSGAREKCIELLIDIENEERK